MLRLDKNCHRLNTICQLILFVIPARAAKRVASFEGRPSSNFIQYAIRTLSPLREEIFDDWIPACAGMTKFLKYSQVKAN